MPIHPTAIIDRQAHVPASCDIGPYVIIDGPVKLGEHVKIYPHAHLNGWTEIGDRVQIHPGAVIGHLPQDFHYSGERSYLRIGAGTIIRENASIHRGTQPESWTILGEDCFILGYAHIGHNCEVGNRVKLYNNSILAGHVVVGDDAIISGLSGVHQFCRIGTRVMIGGHTRVINDVPPYMTAAFEGKIVGYNLIGLRRSKQFTPEEMNEVKEAHRILYRSGLLFRKAIEKLAATAKTRTGRTLVEFLRGESKRGFSKGVRQGDDRRPHSETDAGAAE